MKTPGNDVIKTSFSILPMSRIVNQDNFSLTSPSPRREPPRGRLTRQLRLRNSVYALAALTFVIPFGISTGISPASAHDWKQVFVTNAESLGQELTLPENSSGSPAAGKRVRVTPPEYADTDVHHMLYLPPDWSAADAGQHKWPVIVEYTGNYYPAAGSTGEVEDAGLGFGISQGRFIWVTLPFVSADHKSNAITWWGDERATIEYATANVPRICQQFGGDPDNVLICGFSRGAIAANYIGLHNDKIAKLWRGFIAHDHYDGVRQWGGDWGSPLAAYRERAGERLRRLQGRPSLICQANSTKSTSDYLRAAASSASSDSSAADDSQHALSMDTFTFVDVDPQRILGEFPNPLANHPHTDRWLLKDSPERREVWRWVHQVVTTPRPSPQTTDAAKAPAEPIRVPLWAGTNRQSQSALTVHLAPNPNGAATIICPGGGYGGLVTGAEGHGIAKWLNQHGITGIVLEYELPKGRADVPLQDAQRALRLVRASAGKWKVDPKRLGIMGFSAGGHLASTAGTHFDAGDPKAKALVDRQNCRPDFMILVYPVITMGEITHGGSKRNLLGENPTDKLVTRYSSEKQVNKRTPPAYLAHAKDDRPVPIEHSRMFHAALKQHGVATKLLELPSGGHGLNGYRGPMWDAWQTGSLEWLAEQKFIPK